MKYVLDSCVSFKALIPEVDSDRAIRLLDEYESGVHELISPDILPVEVTHALTRAERQGRMTPARGLQLYLDLHNSLPALFPHLPLLNRAYDLSSLHRIGVYDCLYVALAEQESCELVTSDQKLIARLGPHFTCIIPLSTM